VAATTAGLSARSLTGSTRAPLPRRTTGRGAAGDGGGGGGGSAGGGGGSAGGGGGGDASCVCCADSSSPPHDTAAMNANRANSAAMTIFPRRLHRLPARPGDGAAGSITKQIYGKRWSHARAAGSNASGLASCTPGAWRRSAGILSGRARERPGGTGLRSSRVAPGARPRRPAGREGCLCRSSAKGDPRHRGCAGAPARSDEPRWGR
jgi:hypothetical protein